jgi:isopenicillin-N N-acyltransferase like protein
MMFPIINLAGGAYACGRQYGAAVAPLIRHSIASYARLFAYRRGLDWAASCAEALNYRPLLADVAPHLLEEMAGIADGAGLAFAEILALNVRTELMAGVGSGVFHPEHRAALERNRQAGVPQHSDVFSPTTSNQAAIDDGECTTVAALPEATANGATLLAQTWDWSGDQRAACVVLRIQADNQPAILTVTEAGIVAKIGLNSAGVAVSLNLLRSHADGREPGMPVHVLLRLMLEAPSFEAARALASRLPAAGSSCITLAGARGQVLSLELTPTALGVVEAEGGLLAHANHCVDGTAAAGECPLAPISTSRERAGRGWELLQAARGSISVATMQEILRDREGAPRCICRKPDMKLHPVDRGESVLGAVMEVERGVMHIAPGVPCEVEFEAVSL